MPPTTQKCGHSWKFYHKHPVFTTTGEPTGEGGTCCRCEENRLANIIVELMMENKRLKAEKNRPVSNR